MSMLSSQCDELRQVAQVYRNLGKHATEQMLLDAADTIWQLRDDLQRANADNAKLRELALGLKWCSENYGCKDVCPLYDKSEPEHCREERLWRELGIEANE